MLTGEIPDYLKASEKSPAKISEWHGTAAFVVIKETPPNRGGV
jgi:hypothetical protein